ncbi:hypothetical protein BH11BAC3_BH11BAC3_00250 [soil metagenome]
MLYLIGLKYKKWPPAPKGRKCIIFYFTSYFSVDPKDVNNFIVIIYWIWYIIFSAASMDVLNMVNNTIPNLVVCFFALPRPLGRGLNYILIRGFSQKKIWLKPRRIVPFNTALKGSAIQKAEGSAIEYRQLTFSVSP